jgi:hypothetical protein
MCPHVRRLTLEQGSPDLVLRLAKFDIGIENCLVRVCAHRNLLAMLIAACYHVWI